MIGSPGSHPPTTPGGNDSAFVRRLWIVTPSYRDVESFMILRDRIRTVVQDCAEFEELELQFVVVDDTGGVDPEVSMLQLLADTRVIGLPFNVGHQRAIVCGIRVLLAEMIETDLLVTMDSDGEDRPEDLPQMILPLLSEPTEVGRICIARRTKRNESAQFQVMYFFFRAMFRILTGTTVRSGNYAAYRGWLAQRILLHPYFDLCYSSTLISLGLNLVPVPCPRGERYAGQSRMNPLRLFMHGTRMLMPFTDRIAVRALISFSVIFGAGVAASLVVVAIRVFTTTAVPGWATATLLGILILSVIALSNFVVLFVVFSHSRGISLSGLEERIDAST